MGDSDSDPEERIPGEGPEFDKIRKQVHRMTTEHIRLENELNVVQEENNRLRHRSEQAHETQRRQAEDYKQEADQANRTMAYQRGQIEKLDEQARLTRQRERLEGVPERPPTSRQNIPLRQPELFRTGGNFRRYLQGFKMFARTAEIPNNKIINTLFTFMDQNAQMKVATLNITDEQKEDVESCLEMITRCLEGVTQTVQNRYKLYNMKQQENESLTDFACKLVELADMIYGPEKICFKEQIILDVFIAGIRSDNGQRGSRID